jgi:hypothetical protein
MNNIKWRRNGAQLSRIACIWLVVVLTTGVVISFSGCRKDDTVIVISIKDLEPHWSEWEKHGFDGGEMTLSGSSIFPGGRDTIAFDSHGRLVPPTKEGSKLRFVDEWYPWVNGIVIRTRSALVLKVIKGRGLAYESGEGTCIFPNGTIVFLPPGN